MGSHLKIAMSAKVAPSSDAKVKLEPLDNPPLTPRIDASCKLEPLDNPPLTPRIDEDAALPTMQALPERAFFVTEDGRIAIDPGTMQQLVAAQGEQKLTMKPNPDSSSWESVGQLGPSTDSPTNDEWLTMRFSWGVPKSPIRAKRRSVSGASPVAPKTPLEDSDFAMQVREFTAAQVSLRNQIEANRRSQNQRQYAIAGGLVFLYYAFGVTYYTQQEDWSFVDALYFVTVTLTTVGYGDLLPTTDGAKVVTILFVLVGMFLVASALGIVCGSIIEKLEALDDDDDEAGEEQDWLPEPWNTYLYAGMLLGGSVAVGTIFYAAVERDDFDFIDALYMAVITATTVGYGDASPQTDAGRIFACFWILGAVVCTGKAIGDVADSYAKLTKAQMEERRLKRNVTIADLEEYGGDDGRLDKEEFAICKLIAMSKVSRQDVRLCYDQFSAIDTDHGETIDMREVIGYGLGESKKILAMETQNA